MSLDSLVGRAARGPLSAEERQQLREALSETPEVSSLAVAEALGQGQQLLSAEESARLLETALRRPAAPRRPRFHRVALAVAAMVVAGLVGAFAVKTDGGREKAGPARTAVMFAAQEPGAASAREVASPAVLARNEALRIVVRRTEAGEATLWEDGVEAGQVWKGQLQVGDTVLGPENGRTGLRPTLPGVTKYRLVVCSKADDCEVFPFEVSAP